MRSIGGKKAVVWEGMPVPTEPVDEIADVSIVSNSLQHKTFYAQGLFWAFYSYEGNLVYKTSADGKVWSDRITVMDGVVSYDADIAFDGVYFHFACAPGIPHAVLYLRGKPNADGSITFDSTQTVAESAGDDYFFYYPSINIDSNGYPWIGYLTRTSDLGHSHLYVTKSSTKDGTWTTAGGFPILLSSDQYVYISVVPLTNSKVYVVYTRNELTVKGRLWNGSSLENEETASTSTIARSWLFCAISDGDHVHLAFTKSSTFDLIHVIYTYGSGWGSELTIQTSTQEFTAPALCKDMLTGDIFCFWLGSPLEDHVYYKVYSKGQWGELIDWFVSPSSLVLHDGLSCFNKSYDKKIGLLYDDEGGYITTYSRVWFNYLYVK
jgi:hypothetical protein